MIQRHSIKLRAHRKRSGLTQEEVSFLLGLTKHSAISRFEAGERIPNLETAFALHIVFGGELLKNLFPSLHAEVRDRVKERARQLRQKLRERGQAAKSRYKLKQLERLEQEAILISPGV